MRAYATHSPASCSSSQTRRSPRSTTRSDAIGPPATSTSRVCRRPPERARSGAAAQLRRQRVHLRGGETAARDGESRNAVEPFAHGTARVEDAQTERVGGPLNRVREARCKLARVAGGRGQADILERLGVAHLVE